MDGLGCEGEEDCLPMVLELEDKGAILEDSVVPRLASRVPLVYVYVMYAPAIAEVGAIDVHRGVC